MIWTWSLCGSPQGLEVTVVGDVHCANLSRPSALGSFEMGSFCSHHGDNALSLPDVTQTLCTLNTQKVGFCQEHTNTGVYARAEPCSHLLLPNLLSVNNPPRLFAISAAAPTPQPLAFSRTDSSSGARGKLMKQDIPASGYSTREAGRKSHSLWPWMRVWDDRLLRTAAGFTYFPGFGEGLCSAHAGPTMPCTRQ